MEKQKESKRQCRQHDAYGMLLGKTPHWVYHVWTMTYSASSIRRETDVMLERWKREQR